MQDKKNKHVEGLLWGEGAIANVRWGGARLSDLLSKANIRDTTDDASWVTFASHVTSCEEDDWFGASIPLHKALNEDGDVILAYEASFELIAHHVC